MATALQSEIKKELNRIRKAARRLEARGYQIERIPKYSAKNASRRTLARLKKIKTKQLIEAPGTTYHGAATYGEQVSGKAGRAAERSASAKKSALTRETRRRREASARLPQISVIDDITQIVSNLPDTLEYRYAGVWVQGRDVTPEKNIMLRILENATANVNEEIINYYLSVRGEIEKMAESAQYDSDGTRVEHAIGRMAELIKGAPLIGSEKYDVGAYAESLEDWDIENWEE